VLLERGDGLLQSHGVVNTVRFDVAVAKLD
jgi:hypothetical protein